MYIEKIDDLDILIDRCFPITFDAISLVEYILNDNLSENLSMCEIGTGSGYISLKLKNFFNNIVAVDINKEAITILNENLKNNNIENIKAINSDITKFNGSFDVIVSNPPFFKMNEGKLPSDEIKLISKFEYKLNLGQLIEKTFNLLKKEGIFYFIYPLSRKEELISNISNYDVEILDIKLFNKRIILKAKKN
ncbi:methyltransferase domain-containing protein [Oceanivirga miroungae]|uniref:O-methyltransferase-like protein n=1 Tax=Oceanivirga miroungae TaxID=1130046 RepID=A0A6I8M940_9FUSO|nr:methyltransferase domain-containing protein [Oceanivirga miroungae]VWL84793.1 O-methyltransferase-like protein [Oceanivirga miroungae]